MSQAGPQLATFRSLPESHLRKLMEFIVCQFPIFSSAEQEALYARSGPVDDRCTATKMQIEFCRLLENMRTELPHARKIDFTSSTPTSAFALSRGL